MRVAGSPRLEDVCPTGPKAIYTNARASRLMRLLPWVMVALVVLPLVAADAGAGGGGIDWADPDDAWIRPGTRVLGGSCTSNFIFTDSAETRVFIGTAAHCVNNGPSTATNGCDPRNKPWALGRSVAVTGAAKAGTLVYSSWEAMQRIGETSSATCAGNDFAVVELHPDDHHRVSPAMRGYGGPIGVTEGGDHRNLEKVLTFGNSGLRLTDNPLADPAKAREGYSWRGNGAWTTVVYIAGPGIPGDSGSAVLSSDGTALGVLVTISALGSNGITNLYRALGYANDTGGMDLRLATWALLDPGLLPSPT